MSRSFRPNAIPAKRSGSNTLGERIAEKLISQTLKGRDRVYIQDNCDFCKHLVRMKRTQIRLRARGYKFGCEACAGKFFEWKTAKNILPCWRHTFKKRES